jgi:8-oxo-dGTP diphosphatase
MLKVTCAIIRNEDYEVLVVQKGEKTDHPFKWEFPGGKLKESETEEECIVREIIEELSITIVICKQMEEVAYDYGTKKIVLIPFICDTIEELPFIAEHIAYRWLAPADLKKVDFSEADKIVASRYLEKLDLTENKDSPGESPDRQALNDEELRAMINRMMGMKEADWIATSAIDNPIVFRKLLEFSYSDDKKLAFHASWILSKACDKFPELMDPFLEGTVETLDKIENESTQRSFLRIITQCDLNKISNKHHGLLADHCFAALKSGFSAIAIKAYSMDILYKLALIYPDLTAELTETINMLQDDQPAGIMARGRIILNKLAGISKNPGAY